MSAHRQDLLPPVTVHLTCMVCHNVADATIGRVEIPPQYIEHLDVDAQRLVSELSRLRRQHATDKHGWTP